MAASFVPLDVGLGLGLGLDFSSGIGGCIGDAEDLGFGLGVRDGIMLTVDRLLLGCRPGILTGLALGSSVLTRMDCAAGLPFDWTFPMRLNSGAMQSAWDKCVGPVPHL